MERTGHQSSECVHNYKRTSEQQAEDVSDVLHRSKKVCSTVDRSESEANTVPTGFPGTFNFTSCNSVTIHLQFNTFHAMGPYVGPAAGTRVRDGPIYGPSKTHLALSRDLDAPSALPAHQP